GGNATCGASRRRKRDMWSEQEDVPSLCSPGPEASKASSPSYPWGVVRLADSAVRAVLELVWDGAGYTGLEPFPREFLERLAGLIPADAIIGYHEVEVRRPWRVVDAVEIPPGGVSIEIQQAATPFCPQDPLQNGRHRNERRVLKLSDCLTRREMRKLDFYHCTWKPLGIDDSLRVWLPAPPGR